MKALIFLSLIFTQAGFSQDLGAPFAYHARIYSEASDMDQALKEDGYFCEIFENGVLKLTYKNGNETTEVFQKGMAFETYEKIFNIYFGSRYTFRTHAYKMPTERVHYGFYYLNQDDELTNGIIRQHEVRATFDLVSDEKDFIFNAINTACQQ